MSKVTTEPTFHAAARSSVRGRIVTAYDKKGTYFTLAEAYSQRFIRCYASQKWKEKIGQCWSTGEYVIVEGTYNRHIKSPTITAITDIVLMGDAPEGGWRQAMGCFKHKGGGSTAGEL